MSDWLTEIRPLGDLAKELVKTIPDALADPNLTEEHVNRLSLSLEPHTRAVEMLVSRMKDEGADEGLIEAAEALEELYGDLSEAVAQMVIEMRMRE